LLDFEGVNLFELVAYLVIACLCGATAYAVAGGRGGGLIVLALLGPFLGTWIFARHLFPILWSILGGIMLVAIAHRLVRPRYIDRHVA
jgi:hypothetical protein